MKQCSLISTGFLFVAIIILVMYLLFKKKQPKKLPDKKEDYDNTTIHDLPFPNQYTYLDFPDQKNEEFGMYTGALDSWLQHHPSNISVNRYTTDKKQQIKNVNSVNNVIG